MDFHEVSLMQQLIYPVLSMMFHYPLSDGALLIERVQKQIQNQLLLLQQAKDN